jgi:hypothetical protein
MPPDEPCAPTCSTLGARKWRTSDAKGSGTTGGRGRRTSAQIAGRLLPFVLSSSRLVCLWRRDIRRDRAVVLARFARATGVRRRPPRDGE